MEESLRIREINQIPSPEDFESQLEPLNIPLVFRGCVNHWKAFARWNPNCGGLDYLQERVGCVVVEVMLSRTAPVFYGDIRSHERVPVPFSSFISSCKRLEREVDMHAVCGKSETFQSTTPDTGFSFPSACEQIYLAQVPIVNRENEERVQLESLREDIDIPSFLGTKRLSSINLWMNNAQSRSSTHYDPHHNLLCVVAGCKQVVLWPPSAGPMLYPMPIYGEASNHSSVALDSPDNSLHPRFEHACEYSQKVVLQAGDALLIPEGWYHQVDSEELTLAVNFWWRSNMMSGMLEHMDAYYLRRILRRLVDKEMNQMLSSIEGSRKLGDDPYEPFLNGHSGCRGNSIPEMFESRLNVDISLQDLSPQPSQALRELVSLVHDGLNPVDKPDICSAKIDSGDNSNKEGKSRTRTKSYLLNAADEKNQCASTSDSGVISNKDSKKILMTEFYSLKDDSIANIVWHLKPLFLGNIFLVMVRNFPRSLEALILHLLSPVGAEVLTRKFDELDKLLTEEDRSTFYQLFYSVFEDQFSAMDAILTGKESFALQALKNVLQLYVGVTLDGSMDRL